MVPSVVLCFQQRCRPTYRILQASGQSMLATVIISLKDLESGQQVAGPRYEKGRHVAQNSFAFHGTSYALGRLRFLMAGSTPAAMVSLRQFPPAALRARTFFVCGPVKRRFFVALARQVDPAVRFGATLPGFNSCNSPDSRRAFPFRNNVRCQPPTSPGRAASDWSGGVARLSPIHVCFNVGVA